MRKRILAAVALGAALVMPATAQGVQASAPAQEHQIEQIVLPPSLGGGSNAAPRTASSAAVEGADGVAAAARRVTGRTGRSAGERVDIIAVRGAFVAARVFGPLGSDPVTVVLQQDGGVWNAVAEADAPAGLLDLAAPFTGAHAAAAITSVADRTAREFFGYCIHVPAAVTMTLDKTPNNAFATFAYAGWGSPFVVKPLDYFPGRPLDAWGYDFLRDPAERAERSSFADSSAPPLRAAFFRTGSSDVFVVDWQEGSGVRREFFTMPKGAGILVRATITFAGEAAPDAALVTALQSLRIGDCTGVERLTFSDPYAGFSFDYTATWSVTASEGHSAVLGPAVGGPAVRVLRLNTRDLDGAAAALGAHDATVEVVEETLNGLPAVRVRWNVDGAERTATVAELSSGAIVAIVVEQASTDASVILATFGEYQTV